MDDVVAVQVTHPAYYLSEIEGGQILLKVVFLANFLEETAVGGELQQQVDFIVVVKETIHFEDVWVVGIQLDLYFLHQLCLHASCPHLCLANHFNRAGKTRIDVSAHIDVSELAPPKLPPHLEHVEVQLLVFVGIEDAAEIQQE